MGESGHSPALVGKHFIMNYYTILHDEPQSLYKFYKDDSVYSFGVEGEPLTPESTVIGQAHINEKIASLAFKQCKVHLSVFDAQPTLGGGVLLLVKGTMTSSGSSRKFVQTFLLAQQPSGYYVRNDILRYLAETSDEAKTPTSVSHPQAEVNAGPVHKAEKFDQVAPAVAKEHIPAPAEQHQQQPATSQSVPATPVPEAAQQETKPQVEPAVSAPTTAQVTTTVQAEHEQPKEVVHAGAATPVALQAGTNVPASKAAVSAKPSRGDQAGRGKGKEDKGKEDKGKEDKGSATGTTHAPSGAQAADKVADSTATATTPAKSESADSTWAALAARTKDTPVTPLPVQQTRPKSVRKPEGESSAGAGGVAAATPSADAAPPATAEQPEEKSASDPRSVYVSNLPFSVKRNQVVDAFKGFGKIKNVLIVQEKGYAFIEYETPEIAQNVIKVATENTIYIDERPLRVEERKTKRPGAGGGAGGSWSKRGAGGRSGERPPRGPRPDGKDRVAGSPRVNGVDKRDKNKGEKRGNAGSPVGHSTPTGGQAKRTTAAPATLPTQAPASASVAGGATAGQK